MWGPDSLVLLCRDEIDGRSDISKGLGFQESELGMAGNPQLLYEFVISTGLGDDPAVLCPATRQKCSNGRGIVYLDLWFQRAWATGSRPHVPRQNMMALITCGRGGCLPHGVQKTASQEGTREQV